MATGKQTTYKNRKSNSRGGSRSTSAVRTGSGGRKTKQQMQKEQERKNEIRLFVCLAVCVFFFISNFGWCGVVGNFFAKFMFGIFGAVQYIMPVYVFLAAAFLLSNGAKKAVVNRVLCVGFFILAAAFICQLAAGADNMTAKLLYETGSAEKKGGGFIFGGLLVILYNLTGQPGAVIVICLLIVIGIIVVMNVSLVGMAKERSERFKNRYNSLYEDDEEPDPETALQNKRRTKLDNITVEQKQEPQPQKKKKKKIKNRPVAGEEVHEIKPISQEDLFNPDLTLQDAKDASEGYVDLSMLKKKKSGVTEKQVDFFDRPEFTEREAEDFDTNPEMQNRKDIKSEKKAEHAQTETTAEDEQPDVEVRQETSETRMRKKTKQSEQEMLAERDQIAETIAEAGEQKPAVEYKLPPLKLLKSGKGKGGHSNDSAVRETAMKLKNTLENFGVNVTITDYSCGPSVTRYELQPEQGVKVSKITNLAMTR